MFVVSNIRTKQVKQLIKNQSYVFVQEDLGFFSFLKSNFRFLLLRIVGKHVACRLRRILAGPPSLPRLFSCHLSKQRQTSPYLEGPGERRADVTLTKRENTAPAGDAANAIH